MDLRKCLRFIFLLVFVVSTFTVPNSAQAAAAGFSEYYIPGGVSQLMAILDNIETAAIGTQLTNVVTVSVGADGVTVYYDHWENGYGNGSTGNDEVYIANKGDVLTFRSNIAVTHGAVLDDCTGSFFPAGGSPAGAATRCYDGRDRIYVAGGAVSVAQAFWPVTSNTNFANAWEVYPIKPYQTSYTIPVGEDLYAAGTSFADFLNVYVIVQATSTGTTNVQIDSPGGGLEVNVNLGRGETTELFHIDAGTTVTASAPVQVQFIVGEDIVIPAQNNSRGYTAVPSSLWSTEYYSAVPGFAGGWDTDLFIYNPTGSALTINYQDSVGGGSFVVAANSAESYQANVGRYVPVNSAVYLAAANGTTKFWAIGSVDAGSPTFNWGFALLPPASLTSEYYISWAPGGWNQAGTGSPQQSSYSPLYVTPVNDNTTIFVDNSPADGVVDQTFTLDRIEMQRIFDTVDADNTGLHIWATGPIAVVWGEDPSTSLQASPGLDAGYTILPLNQDWIEIVLTMDKSVAPTIITTATGQIATFTLVTATDQFGLQEVSVVDDLPSGWAYVSGSTTITLPDNSTITGISADPDIVGQQLTWNDFPIGPLDMNGNETLTIQFQAETTSTPTQDFYINEATATGTIGTETFSSSDTATVEVLQLALGAITGSVLADTNNDDTGDVPLAGVKLELLDSVGNVIATTTTLSDGSYSFTNIPPGDYQVREIQPTDYDSVSDIDGGDLDLIGDVTPITIVAGEINSGNDFIEEQPGAITGTVWADTNNDNIGDTPIVGVTIELLDSLGNVIATTTTLADGTYSFTNVPPGDYQARETQPVGYNSVSDKDGGNLDLIGDATPITVLAGQTNTGNDFVEEQSGAISGTVWADTNNDNIGDTAIGGVTLALLDNLGNVVATTTTLANGTYSFTNIPPGDYQVRETQPAGYDSVSDRDGGNLDLIGDQALIAVTAGATNAGNDFVEEQFGAITGTVMADTNNDNIGDVPIAGVTLELLDSLGNVIATTTTLADGTYSFTNVPLGDYQVRETQPAGYGSTSDSDSGNLDLIGDQTLITVTAGATSTGNNFVEQEFGSISGQVRYDGDNDGDPGDVDSAIVGVTIELYENGVLVATTVTNSSGNYTFTDLLSGDYTVVEINLPGYTSTYDLDGTAANTLDQIAVTLAIGQNSTGNDFLDTSISRINVEKNPPTQTVAGGTDVNFTITVTNEGAVDLTSVTVTDVLCNILTRTNNGNGDATLAVGETWTYACTVNNVTADFTNTVNAVGTPPTGPNVTDSDTADVDVLLPVIAVTKDASVASVPETGGSVTFTYTVTNTGTVDVTITSLTDDVFGSLTGDTDCQVGTKLMSNASCNFALTANLSGAAGIPHVNVFTANAEDGSGNPARDTDDATVDFTPIPSGLEKTLTGTNSTYTTGSKVAIGEILTYQVKVVIPQGDFTNARLVDTMDRGLAFVGCDSIDAPGLTTDVAGSFTQICANPTTDDAGGGTPMDVDRRVTFNFGTLSNTGQSDVTLTVTYRAIVLNNAANVNGVSLKNTAVWSWAGGSIGPAQTEVTLVEPDIQINKTSDVNFIGDGAEVTFTLTVSHTSASTADAFDVVATDVLPIGLDYIANSLECTSGAQDPDVECVYDVPTRTIRAEWSVFKLNGGNGQVRFRVIGNDSLPADGNLVNTANVQWASMFGDQTTPDSFSDPANQFSTERYYAPADLINLYGDSDSLALTSLGGDGGDDDDDDGDGGNNTLPPVTTFTGGFLIPVTGFAPNTVTKLAPSTYTAFSPTDLAVEIPVLKVQTNIVGVELKDGNWDVSWLQDQAGWLEGTAYPTWSGNSILTAHSVNKDGKPGVFAKLKYLKAGEYVFVYNSGYRYTYKVVSNASVKPNDTSVLRHEEKSYLTLITCDNYDEKTGAYLNRIAIRAVLVDVRPVK